MNKRQRKKRQKKAWAEIRRISLEYARLEAERFFTPIPGWEIFKAKFREHAIPYEPEP